MCFLSPEHRTTQLKSERSCKFYRQQTFWLTKEKHVFFGVGGCLLGMRRLRKCQPNIFLPIIPSENNPKTEEIPSHGKRWSTLLWLKYYFISFLCQLFRDFHVWKFEIASYSLHFSNTFIYSPSLTHTKLTFISTHDFMLQIVDHESKSLQKPHVKMFAHVFKPRFCACTKAAYDMNT